MTRKKQSPDSVSTTGQGNYEKQQPKVNIFDPQLQLPWYNLPLPETSKISQPIASRDSVLRDSSRLDRADQKMQKITERLEKRAESLPHPEFSFEDSVPTLPPVIEPPVDLMPDDESNPIRELPENFIGKGEVRGFKFTQIKMSNHAYLYHVQPEGKPQYEVFERRVNTLYGNISYPGKEAFGVSAWTTCDLQKALEIFDEINYRRNEPCA